MSLLRMEVVNIAFDIYPKKGNKEFRFLLGDSVVHTIVGRPETAKKYKAYIEKFLQVPFHEVVEKVSGWVGVGRLVFEWRLANGV